MKKKVMFLMLIIAFFVCLLVSFSGIYKLSFEMIEDIKATRNENNNLINELKINNLKISRDNDTNTFFYYIPYDGDEETVCLNFDLKFGYKYNINDIKFNCIDIEYNKEYEFIIFNNTEYFISKLVFTNLPTLQITLDNNINDGVNNGLMYLTDYDEASNHSLNYVQTELRGATSQGLTKKPYKISIFKNDKYEKDKDVSLLGMYLGHTYILDALANDPSKIRNLLSSELWNEMSSDNTSIEGKLVELFVNDSYYGLYALKEPVNATNLNIKYKSKTNNSILIKAVSPFDEWSVNTDYSNITEYFYNKILEIKYPNEEEYYQRSWDVFLTKITPFHDLNINNDYELLDLVFDMDNYTDFVVFASVVNHIDNHFQKNMYYYMKSLSSDIFLIPWDLDQTFGSVWDGNVITNTVPVPDSYTDLSFFPLLYGIDPKLDTYVADKYIELRKTVITKENIYDLIEGYRQQLSLGAAEREMAKWPNGYDIFEEMDGAKTWASNRLDFLDELVGEYYEQ